MIGRKFPKYIQTSNGFIDPTLIYKAHAITNMDIKRRTENIKFAIISFIFKLFNENSSFSNYKTVKHQKCSHFQMSVFEFPFIHLFYLFLL